MSRYDQGMEDAYYGFGPSSRGSQNEDYMNGYYAGQALIEEQYYAAAERAHFEQQIDEHYRELECEHYGHERHGDGDRFGARCHCGKVRWLTAVRA